jgi:hypothetical protein
MRRAQPQIVHPAGETQSTKAPQIFSHPYENQ